MTNLQRIVHMVFGSLALAMGLFLAQSDRLAMMLNKGWAPPWWQAGISVAFIAGGTILLLHWWRKIGLVPLTFGYLIIGLFTGIVLRAGWLW